MQFSVSGYSEEMDGVGSRLGRASSRYGPTPVFTGPVRRWKKQWVHHITTATTTFNSNGNGNKAVRLPRWTPVSSSSDAVKSEEPPRRKLRYTPIVVLEEKKKYAAKGGDIESRASKTNQLMTRETTEETETSDRKDAARNPLTGNRMGFDLSLNDNDVSDDSDGDEIK